MSKKGHWFRFRHILSFIYKKLQTFLLDFDIRKMMANLFYNNSTKMIKAVSSLLKCNSIKNLSTHFRSIYEIQNMLIKCRCVILVSAVGWKMFVDLFLKSSTNILLNLYLKLLFNEIKLLTTRSVNYFTLERPRHFIP